ncbi:hypothetical protein TNCV_1239651 [Trichonephila clavipes]|nr:hypothetical protein TNCV_1239651 [Trichonephila clavipes]
MNEKRWCKAKVDCEVNKNSVFSNVRLEKLNTVGQSSAEFSIWYEGHKSECDINHLGSSTSMEMEAALTLWKDPHHLDSVILQYYPMVIVKRLTTCAVYGPDIVIKKEECINHVSKRLEQL